jgi:hypothetical protein
MRFFKIEEAGLTELDRHGLPLFTSPVESSLPVKAASSARIIPIPGEVENASLQGFLKG